MVTRPYNSSTQKAEAGGCQEFKASLAYIVRFHLKQKKYSYCHRETGKKNSVSCICCSHVFRNL